MTDTPLKEVFDKYHAKGKPETLSLKENTTTVLNKTSLVSKPKRKDFNQKHNKYSDKDKEMIASKTMIMVKGDLPISKIASALTMSRRTLSAILSNDVVFADWRKKQKAVLDTATAKLALKAFREASRRLDDPDSIKFKDLVIAGAIAHDKFSPPVTSLQQFNVDGNVDIAWQGWDTPHNVKK